MNILLDIIFVVLAYFLITSINNNHFFAQKDILNKIDDLEEKILSKLKDLKEYESEKHWETRKEIMNRVLTEDEKKRKHESMLWEIEHEARQKNENK